MDFQFDDSIREKIKAVSTKFDASYWRNISSEKKFPEEYWKALSAGGFFGHFVDKKFGGMEKGLVDFVLSVEETAEHYAGIGSYIYLGGSLVSTIFQNCASEEQKASFLPLLARGELKISIALGEEMSGYDVSSMETSARKVSGDSFEIEGSKSFVNNVDNADYLILFARTTPLDKNGKKMNGISMFIVDAKDQAIKKTKLDKLGWDFVNNYRLKIEGLRVSNSQFLGEPDKAWYSVVSSFNIDRVATSASLVGTGWLALNQASSWARERKSFGRTIGSNQGVQFPLADAGAQLEAAWVMTLKAASLSDMGKNYVNEANYSLLTSSRAASAAAERSLQAFGGHGYYREYDVERYWRDVRAHRVHPVSEELLLASIADRCLGLPKSY